MELNSSLHRFDPDDFGTVQEILDPRAAGNCDILFIGCSDQVAALDQVSCADRDRFYLLQNLAGSVPCSGVLSGGSTCASIDFAIEQLQVRHAIVCGHDGCRVIADWIGHAPGTEQSPAACRFHRKIRVLVETAYPDAPVHERLKLLVREHTLSQLENLRSYPCVNAALRAGTLKLHGWIADDVTSRVQIYDPVAGQFTTRAGTCQKSSPPSQSYRRAPSKNQRLA